MNTANLIPLKKGEGGRKMGAINKSTRERNEQLRKHLMNTNVIFKAVTEINNRLDNNPESVKMSELINIIAKIGSYLYQTVSEEHYEDVVETITSRDQAEGEVRNMLELVSQLKAVK
ncbi:hypothetical protein OH773_06760 [Buttiauxella sp. WJP83]|uniref:hypothetical protein n=1 Tax=Buttiauxella sp. WJP83 TaxID=2986951 RepID=UPI0022DD5655|nr:hypothetical protein [Buttiauxella sp. WJP83]WBM71936.1 hypothetical protein OH773_06760 [Buttiauxella sp. WJP83]